MVVGSPEGSRPGETVDTTTEIGVDWPRLDIGIAEVHDAAIASTMRTLAVEIPPRQQSKPRPAGSEAEMTGQEVVVERIEEGLVIHVRRVEASVPVTA